MYPNPGAAGCTLYQFWVTIAGQRSTNSLQLCYISAEAGGLTGVPAHGIVAKLLGGLLLLDRHIGPLPILAGRIVGVRRIGGDIVARWQRDGSLWWWWRWRDRDGSGLKSCRGSIPLSDDVADGFLHEAL